MRAVHDLLSMEGRVVVVSGGAGHLGRASADALAQLGARIVVLDLDHDRCEAVAADLTATRGVDAIGIGCDLRDDDAVRAVPARAVERFGRLDVVVNLASLVGTSEGLKGWAVPLPEQDLGTWRQALDVGLTSAFALVQAAAPALAASGSGSIVNVASIYGVVGPDQRLYEGTAMGNPAAYAAAKGGLVQLTRWLATTLAPDVRVNTISPGGVWRDQDEQFVERYTFRTPMQRMATEEDVIGAVVYLASDLSAYVTGQNLGVDGGWTAW